MNDADKLVVLALVREIEIQQAATSQIRRLAPLLAELQSALERAVLARDPAVGQLSHTRAARMAALLSDVHRAAGRAFEALATEIESFLLELRAIEEQNYLLDWLLVLGLGLDLTPAEVEPLIGGATPLQVAEKLATDVEVRVAAAVRSSVASGATAEETVALLRGKTDLAPPVLDQTARTIEIAVRTGAAGVPSEVTMRSTPAPPKPEAKKPKPSPIGPHGYRHVSTLDRRTSDICRARAWKVWDADLKPIGHSLPFAQPPLHTLCRSYISLCMLNDPEPARKTFKDFVDSLTPSAAEELFGAARLAAWRRGTLSDSDLLRGRGSKAITLKELKRRTEAKGQDGYQLPFPDL